MAKHILINPEDAPTKLQLIHAASRLRKCAELLKKSRGSKNTEDPTSFIAVASFLEMMVKRDSKILRKDEEVELNDEHVKSMLKIALEYFETLSEESKAKAVSVTGKASAEQSCQGSCEER